MVKTKEGDTVKLHYTGKLKDGGVFNSTVDGDPLEITIGEGQVIEGFEEAVIGMTPGESKTTTVPSEKAFGPVKDDLIFAVPRDQLPKGIEPKEGQVLEMRQGDGQQLPVTITFVTEGKVTLDANHPLANRDLVFDIELLEIV